MVSQRHIQLRGWSGSGRGWAARPWACPFLSGMVHWVHPCSRLKEEQVKGRCVARWKLRGVGRCIPHPEPWVGGGWALALPLQTDWTRGTGPWWMLHPVP